MEFLKEKKKGEDISEDAGDLGETPRSAASRGTARRRPAPSAAGPSPRAVRPRTGQPESEPSRDSRRSSSATPASWPNVASNLDDLPLSIRQHLERASQLAEQDPSTTVSLAFVALTSKQQEGLRKAMEKRNGSRERRIVATRTCHDPQQMGPRGQE